MATLEDLGADISALAFAMPILVVGYLEDPG